MFRKIRMFFVGLWRVFVEGLRWLGRKIMDGFRAIGRGIKRACMWLIDLPYKAMGFHLLSRIGKVLHKMLFHFLLPKKYRNATKQQLYEVIFNSDTKAGKKFDIWLMVLIALSVIVLMVESVPAVQKVVWLKWTFVGLEWLFTIGFTFEYYLRIYCLKKPMKYVTSFYGIIDFLAIFPAYLGLFLPAARTFMVFRMLRLLRIFVLLDMKRFIKESKMMMAALWRSAMKVTVFMLFVFLLAVILGSIMYMVETKYNAEAFDSIPAGIYWAVETLTTMGHSSVVPLTPVGRFISVVMMILGYSLIAVPTGVVAGETIEGYRREREHAQSVVRREDKWMSEKLNPNLQAGDEVEKGGEDSKNSGLFRKKEQEVEYEMKPAPDVEIVYPKGADVVKEGEATVEEQNAPIAEEQGKDGMVDGEKKEEDKNEK